MNPPEVNGLIERARTLIVAAMPDVVAAYVFGSAA
jgi:predicted nucleotidyltransferase